MGIKQDYEQKQADYERLKELCHGQDVDDYCGAWCNNDVLTDMLRNPTKKNAMYYYSSLITTYFNRGYEDDKRQSGAIAIDLNDHEVYEILKRNGDVG